MSEITVCCVVTIPLRAIWCNALKHGKILLKALTVLSSKFSPSFKIIRGVFLLHLHDVTLSSLSIGPTHIFIFLFAPIIA